MKELAKLFGVVALMLVLLPLTALAGIWGAYLIIQLIEHLPSWLLPHP